MTFHNPSGHTKEAGIATLPVTTFDRFAAHRGIALHLQTFVTAKRTRKPGSSRLPRADTTRRLCPASEPDDWQLPQVCHSAQPFGIGLSRQPKPELTIANRGGNDDAALFIVTGKAPLGPSRGALQRQPRRTLLVTERDGSDTAGAPGSAVLDASGLGVCIGRAVARRSAVLPTVARCVPVLADGLRQAGAAVAADLWVRPVRSSAAVSGWADGQPAVAPVTGPVV